MECNMAPIDTAIRIRLRLRGVRELVRAHSSASSARMLTDESCDESSVSMLTRVVELSEKIPKALSATTLSDSNLAIVTVAMFASKT